jgi:hypothetical protein
LKNILKCIQSKEIIQMANLNDTIDYETLQKICPVMLYNFEIGNCQYDTGVTGLKASESKAKIDFFSIKFF